MIFLINTGVSNTGYLRPFGRVGEQPCRRGDRSQDGCDFTFKTMDITPKTMDFTPKTMDVTPKTMDFSWQHLLPLPQVDGHGRRDADADLRQVYCKLQSNSNRNANCFRIFDFETVERVGESPLKNDDCFCQNGRFVLQYECPTLSILSIENA